MATCPVPTSRLTRTVDNLLEVFGDRLGVTDENRQRIGQEFADVLTREFSPVLRTDIGAF